MRARDAADAAAGQVEIDEGNRISGEFPSRSIDSSRNRPRDMPVI